MIIALIEGGYSNPEALNDMLRFGNRVDVGMAFVDAQEQFGIRYSALTADQQALLRTIGQEILVNVTADSGSREAAIDEIPERLAVIDQALGGDWRLMAISCGPFLPPRDETTLTIYARATCESWSQRYVGEYRCMEVQGAPVPFWHALCR